MTDVEVSRTGDGISVDLWSGPLRGVDLHLPGGWEAARPEDPEEFLWEHGDLVLRVRIREAPSFGVDAEIRNDGDEPATTVSPVLALRARGPRLPWLAGASGQVLLPQRGGGAVFRQWRGHCSAPPGQSALDGIALFGETAWVRPGQAVGAGWRLEIPDSGALPRDPDWLPARRHVPEGEEIELLAPDAALSAPALTEVTVGDATHLSGPVGVHEIRLSDARGTTTLEVGWHLHPAEVAAEALGRAASPDVSAWLLTGAAGAAGPDDPAVVDRLDALLGQAFETPTLWGVLAGLRAASTTDLPVRTEVEAAAAALLAEDPASELGPILTSQGLVHGVGRVVGEGPAMDWWNVLTRDDEELRQQVLGWLDHGRVSSLPPVHGARGIALACLWLASRESAHGQLEVVAAATNTYARLLALHSVDPDPTEVCWLLLADSWLFEA